MVSKQFIHVIFTLLETSLSLVYYFMVLFTPVYVTIYMYSGITSGRVLNGELLYTKIMQTNANKSLYMLCRFVCCDSFVHCSHVCLGSDFLVVYTTIVMT